MKQTQLPNRIPDPFAENDSLNNHPLEPEEQKEMLKQIKSIVKKVRPELRKRKVIDAKVRERTLSILIPSEKKRKITKRERK